MSEEKLTRDEELTLIGELLEHTQRVYVLYSKYLEEYAELVTHIQKVEAKLGCRFFDYKL